MRHRACPGCGYPVPPGDRERNPRKWCSEACRLAALRVASGPGKRRCVECSSEITTRNQGAMYCSKRCQSKSAGSRRRLASEYTCRDCGADVDRPPTRGQRPKWCDACRRKRGRFQVAPSVRLAIYERDKWTCQICLEPIDRDAQPRTDWSPTLDHIECQASSETPDHSPENLRTAHHWCNSVLSDGRAYSDADFREVA